MDALAELVVVEGKIYAVGGDEPGSPLTYEYDLGGDRWQPRSSMPYMSWYFGGAASLGGEIYYVGGYGGDWLLRSLADGAVYDPQVNLWTHIAPLSAPGAPVLVAAENGYLYAVSKDRVERYSPSSDLWATVAPTIGSGWPKQGAQAPDGHIYVIKVNESEMYFEAYDMVADHWEKKSGIPIRPSAHAVALLPFNNGHFLVVTDHLFDYDPSADIWKDLGEFADDAGAFSGVVGNDGKLYVLTPRGVFYEGTVTGGADSSIVTEARYDIGMPYNTDRGCSSSGACGGPFHGYYAGVCTDVAIDAYMAGADFNIQTLLRQDHVAQQGRYRHGNARYADDMRVYFMHNQLLLPHSGPYLPGDVAFFDWEGDGITNHVNLVSEVDSAGRPLKMVDATGSYEENLSGFAFEHEWTNYYDQHSQGHGRLRNMDAIASVAENTPLQQLHVSVESPAVELRLFDATGKAVSEQFDENLVASNVESFIPYIPRAEYINLGVRKSITVTWPISNTTEYVAEVRSIEDTTYHVGIYGITDGVYLNGYGFDQPIGAGEVHVFRVRAKVNKYGFLDPYIAGPTSAPIIELPEILQLFHQVGMSTQVQFDVTEVGGDQALENATLSVANLTDQIGRMLPSDTLTITPSQFEVFPGKGQQISIRIAREHLAPGTYWGAIILSSANGPTVEIPLKLDVQPETSHVLYLPTIKSTQ